MASPNLHLDSDYINFLESIKTQLKKVLIRAAFTVNSELIIFYWQLGNELTAKQKQFKGAAMYWNSSPMTYTSFS